MSDGSGAPAYPHVRHAKGVLKRNIPYWVGGTFPLVLGIAATVTGIRSPNAGDALPVGLALLAGTPFIFIPIFLELRSRPRAAVATDRGLGWRDRGGDHVRPWAEVSALWRYDELGDRNARGYSKVVFADEQKVTFDQTLSNYETLAESIQTLASATLLPGYRQAVATGGGGVRASHAAARRDRDRQAVLSIRRDRGFHAIPGYVGDHRAWSKAEPCRRGESPRDPELSGAR